MDNLWIINGRMLLIAYQLTMLNRETMCTLCTFTVNKEEQERNLQLIAEGLPAVKRAEVWSTIVAWKSPINGLADGKNIYCTKGGFSVLMLAIAGLPQCKFNTR